MKLSPKTMKVLKNFAKINDNLKIKPGSMLKTITDSKSVAAVAKVDVKFEKEIAIYNLSEFLSVLNLVSEPELDFSSDNFITISGSGGGKIKYVLANPDVVTGFDKDVKLPSEDVVFTITEEEFASALKAASVLKNQILAFEPGSEGGVKVNVFDVANPSNNRYELDIESAPDTIPDSKFSVHFLVDYMFMIPGNYRVTISNKGIAKFENLDANVSYFVGTEKSSSYAG